MEEVAYGFSVVPKLVTYRERRNGRYFCRYGANYTSQWLKLDLTVCEIISSKNLVYGIDELM